MAKAKAKWTRLLVSFWVILAGLVNEVDCFADAKNPDSLLTATWSNFGSNQSLKTWTLKDLQQLKKTSSREKDPLTGKVVRWDGVLLSQVVDQALDQLPVEGRAQIDLIIVKGEKGARVLVPRAFISKYPVLLAIHGNSEQKDSQFLDRGPLFTVVPWTSKPRILNEDLPLDHFFVPNVVKIELTNYRDQFSALYLKRRTDPAAMRGEKLFVQNCVSCHIGGKGPSLARVTDQADLKLIQNSGHPALKVLLKLSERDRKSIFSYIHAHREENQVASDQSIRTPAQKN